MKKLLFPLFISAIAVFILQGCSPRVEYVGKSYAPTSNVDIYLDPADIDRDYEVMGAAEIKNEGTIKFDKLQESAMESAMQHGADAVLIESMDEVSSGSTSTTTGSANNDDKNSTFSQTTNNYERTEKLLRVKYLKYRN